MGYMVSSATSLREISSYRGVVPDVVLVRKSYPEKQKSRGRARRLGARKAPWMVDAEGEKERSGGRRDKGDEWENGEEADDPELGTYLSI